MSKDLVVFEEDQLQLMKTTVAKGLNDKEFMFFTEVCKARGLNPLLGQIHCAVHKDKQGNRNLTFITGIDGFRKTAHATGVYAGRDKAIFTFNDKKMPQECEVTVYKIVQGVRCPFTATAVWSEYLPGDSRKQFMWRKMPQWMLEKCTEAKALRMAFTNELGGFYEEGEAMQISDEREIKDVNDMNKVVKNEKQGPALPSAPEPEEMPTIEDEMPDWDSGETPSFDQETEQPPEQEEDYRITDKQIKRLFAISRTQKWKDADVRAHMEQLCGVESTKDLTKTKYDFLVDYIQTNQPDNL